MGSERPTYTLTVVTPRYSLSRVSMGHQVQHAKPAFQERHTLVHIRRTVKCRIRPPALDRPRLPQVVPGDPAVNALLLGLHAIDVSLVRSQLLIHAQKGKGILTLPDLLVHFRQVFHTEHDVRYFLSVQGDGWFVPQGPGMWKVKHPDWWR